MFSTQNFIEFMTAATKYQSYLLWDPVRVPQTSGGADETLAPWAVNESYKQFVVYALPVIFQAVSVKSAAPGVPNFLLFVTIDSVFGPVITKVVKSIRN